MAKNHGNQANPTLPDPTGHSVLSDEVAPSEEVTTAADVITLADEPQADMPPSGATGATPQHTRHAKQADLEALATSLNATYVPGDGITLRKDDGKLLTVPTVGAPTLAEVEAAKAVFVKYGF